jgi:hypothetical protein
MEQLLAKLKVPPDAAAAELYQSVQPLRQMVAFQAAFVAGCCQQAMELGTSKLQEKFAFTWQQRLAAYRALPDGTEVPPPDGDAAAPPELLVGLVGCGALGSTVVQTLLDAGFAPSQLLVSTRSPQQHQALLAQGVRVAFHNAGVAARVHLLVLAVLPAQLADVAKDIRGALSPRAPRLPAAAPPTTTHTHTLLAAPLSARTGTRTCCACLLNRAPTLTPRPKLQLRHAGNPNPNPNPNQARWCSRASPPSARPSYDSCSRRPPTPSRTCCARTPTRRTCARACAPPPPPPPPHPSSAPR